MPSCAVNGCKNRTSNRKINELKAVHYYTFPKSKEFCDKWIIACGRLTEFSVNTARICSEHFAPDCKLKSLQRQLLGVSPVKTRKLKEDALPTLHLPKTPTETIEPGTNPLEEYKLSMAAKKIGDDLICELMDTEAGTEVDSIINEVPELHSISNLDLELANLKEENERLQRKLEELQHNELKMVNLKSENGALKIELEKSEDRNIARELEFTKVLSKIFTPGQVKLLLNPEKRINWSHEDICAAMSLRSVSPKAYRYLRTKLNYPLPGLSTLRKWAQLKLKKLTNKKIY